MSETRTQQYHGCRDAVRHVDVYTCIYVLRTHQRVEFLQKEKKSYRKLQAFCTMMLQERELVWYKDV